MTLNSDTRYHPSDRYDIFLKEDATDEEMLSRIIDELRAFLALFVLRPREKEYRIRHIQEIRAYLRHQYLVVLRKNGLDDLVGKIDLENPETINVEEICREIDNPAVIVNIRKFLDNERDSLDAEFLERLGFLPDTEFSRRTGRGRPPEIQQDLFDASSMYHHQRAPQSFKLLCQSFPSWFPAEAISHPENLVPMLTPDKLLLFPTYARLARWITNTNTNFRQCVRRAFNHLSSSFESAAPVSGPEKQRYEISSDLGGKSFTGLLQIIMNRKTDFRRRLEALAVLEWAVAFFSLENNPIFQAVQEVRADIEELLGIVFWETGDASEDIPISPRVSSMVRWEEEGKPSELGKSIMQSARKVNRRVVELLKKHSGAAVFGMRDCVIFSSRVKGLRSTAAKIFEYDEIARECEAAFLGIKTGFRRQSDAGQKLYELQERMRNLRLRSDEDLVIKPVGLDTVDDSAGFLFVVELQKPLSEYTEEERPHVDSFFEEFAEYLMRTLRLENVGQLENHLWRSNTDNPKSSDSFRVFKINAKYPIQHTVFDEQQRLVQRMLKVPVEIQLCPIETHLRKFHEGEAGVKRYKERQLQRLIQRFQPREVRGVKVYPPISMRHLRMDRLQDDDTQ